MCDLAHPRRRSVDVGGLALALGVGQSGHGWGGWEETDKGETRCVPIPACLYRAALTGPAHMMCLRYAEALIDVRAHTETVVNVEPLHLYVLVPSRAL